MQTLVSKSICDPNQIERQTKRFKSDTYSSPNEYVSLPKRTPINRLKLQFPDLDEEVSNHPNFSYEFIHSYYFWLVITVFS